MENNCVRLSEIVGGGYNEFWNFKGRYRAVKGSRGSKKSCTTALWYIEKMMEFYAKYKLKPNVLVIRKHVYLNKNSTRAQLIWAMDKLGVRDLWRIPMVDSTLTYKPSGQKIYFRGLDDSMSLTSIIADDGQLCWVWFEEAFQMNKEDDFNKIDMSIRGDMPKPLFKQITLTFNPWSDKHWLKRRFFDVKDDPNILAMTTTYMCNEFLGADDIELFEQMKRQNPKRYRIEGLGEWGISEGLVFSNWEQAEFDIKEVIEKHPKIQSCNGMDFGYNDPTAFVGAYADLKSMTIWIWYEFFAVTMENSKIAQKLIDDGFRTAKIIGDSEDPRTINELRLLGLERITGAKKGSGSVLGGIQRLQDFHIIIHNDCTNTINAFSNYAWKRDNKTDAVTNTPEHDFSHIPDALRYGTEDLHKAVPMLY